MMKDVIEFIVAVILGTLGILILAGAIIFSCFFIASLFPTQGQQNAIIEKVYVDGVVNKTNELKVFPIKMGSSSDYYTVDDASVLDDAKMFLTENKVVLITYHCGAWNPYKSASIGCFADKIEEVN